MSDQPVSSQPEDMKVLIWSRYGQKTAKIIFLQIVQIPSATTRSFTMVPMGIPYYFQAPEPDWEPDYTKQVVGASQLHKCLAERGFTEEEQTEIFIGACQSYLLSYIDENEFETPER